MIFKQCNLQTNSHSVQTRNYLFQCCLFPYLANNTCDDISKYYLIVMLTQGILFYLGIIIVRWPLKENWVKLLLKITTNHTRRNHHKYQTINDLVLLNVASKIENIWKFCSDIHKRCAKLSRYFQTCIIAFLLHIILVESLFCKI